MEQKGFRRKLTAILSADVAGYSRLMQDDEAATVKTLEAYKQIISDLVKQHRGRVVDSPGDNLLAEFASVVDAVQCAVATQKELQARNAELPENRKMQFRIGVNLGDVIEEESRIYGDGVNIAARLESIADPGGVCISGSAFEHAENKLPLEYKNLGDHSFKSMRRPVRVYRIVIDHESMQRLESKSKADPLKMVFPLSGNFSIVVLPFVNMSDDKEQEYFADGLTEELINSLSKIEHVSVISRSSSFSYKSKPIKVQAVAEEMGVHYVLEGSVRKTENKIRITAQLVDALSGRPIFSERYDHNIKDVFTVQDEITMKIVTSLQVALTKGEAYHLFDGTRNLDAYLCVLKAMQLKSKLNREGVAMARRYAEEAIALDPEYAGGYSTLAGVIFNEVVVGLKPRVEAIQEALVVAEKAVALAPSYAYGREMLSMAYSLSQNPEKAISEAEKAIALSPSSAYAYHCMGTALMAAERFHDAIQMFQKSLRMSPIPHTSGVLGLLGLSYRFVGCYEEAIATYQRMLTLYPDSMFAHGMLACTYATLARSVEALAEANEVLKIEPSFSSERFVNGFPIIDKEFREVALKDLRKAGLK